MLELKNPADENADIFKAYNQLQTYKDEIEDLFVYNEALVISDGINARVGSLTATNEWYMYWRTIKDETDKPLLEYELDTLIKGFFDKEYRKEDRRIPSVPRSKRGNTLSCERI